MNDGSYSLRKKLITAERDNQAMKDFLASLGFMTKHNLGGVMSFKHERAKPCVCGHHPYVTPSVYEPGKWIAQCPECASRTVDTDNPVAAVKAWNRDEVTEETKLCRTKLDLCEEGAQNLAEALKKDAVDTLMWYEKVGHLEYPEARDAAWFINNEAVVQDIVSGDRRRRKEEEERNKAHDNDSEGTDSDSSEFPVFQDRRISLEEEGQDHDSGEPDHAGEQ